MIAEIEVMIVITKEMTTEMKTEKEEIETEIEDVQIQKKMKSTVEVEKVMTATIEWENNLVKAIQKKVTKNEDQTAAISSNKKIKVRIN